MCLPVCNIPSGMRLSGNSQNHLGIFRETCKAYFLTTRLVILTAPFLLFKKTGEGLTERICRCIHKSGRISVVSVENNRQGWIMIKNVIKLFNKILLYARLYGVSGLIFLTKRAFFKNQVISFRHSSLRYPVYIRNNSSDMAVFGMIFNDRGYQCDVDFEPKVIVDCGANIGLAAVYFKNRFPNAKVIAVEPEKENFELMVKNLEQYPDVHCLRSGVWGKDANLVVEDIGNGNWGWVVREVDAPGANTIPAVSIGKIMEMYNLTGIDILKIDIEGSEVDVFSRNYEQWLPAVKIIMIELHDRIIQGAAKSFFETLVKYNFILAHRGECHIIYMK